MANIIEIIVRGTDDVTPTLNEIKNRARSQGQPIGGEISKGIGDRIAQDLPGDVEKPLEDSGRKGGQKGGKAAGDSFLAGASPLMLGAFAGAATIGPALLIGGVATAVGGIAALVAKSNADVAAQYHDLGGDVMTTLTNAVAPFAGDITKSIQILDQGLAGAGPELTRVFAAAAPYSEEIAKALVAIVTNMLPGFAAGLREAAPLMSVLADFAGKLGMGVGEFAQTLGTGAGGAAVGLKAIGDALSHILPDLGQIIGSLSNGLGPALRDVLNVATPAVDMVARFVSVIPPQAIESAAVATGALFAAFKVGTIANVVAEGTTFVGFLKALLPAEVAVEEETGVLSATMTRMGAVAMSGAGLLGILAGVTTGLYYAIRNDNGAMNGMIDKIAAQAKAEQQQIDVLKATKQATEAAANSFDALSGMLTDATLKSQEHARQSAATTLAALGFRDGESAVATQLDITLQAFTENSGAASAYKTALDALYGKYQSYSDAQATFTTDLANTAKQLKYSSDGFETNTTAGAANYTLMSNLATANENRAEALLKETGNQQQANRELQNGALAIDAMAKKANFTKAQIDALNLALYGTKNIGDISVPISADTSGVYSEVDKVINWIGAQTAYVQVQTVGGAPGGRAYTNAHGGVIGAFGQAASGGARGGMTLVGEQGPELVTLPFGSTVHSNPDSRRMAAEAAGGSSVMTLEVAPGGASAFEQFMVMALRNWVRVRAGNGPNSVQKAFGQSF